MSAARIREVMGVRHSAFENRGSISICGAYEGRGMGKWTGYGQSVGNEGKLGLGTRCPFAMPSPIYDVVGR